MSGPYSLRDGKLFVGVEESTFGVLLSLLKGIYPTDCNHPGFPLKNYWLALAERAGLNELLSLAK